MALRLAVVQEGLGPGLRGGPRGREELQCTRVKGQAEAAPLE